MGWGGGWGNHVPDTARTVAKAFYEGRTCKRSNCHTDGRSYWLENSIIARRVPDSEIVEHISENIRLGKRRPLLEFSFAGWPTKMTARHLTALGVDAGVIGIKNPECYLSGKPCAASGWYTKEDIAALPPKPVKSPRPVREPTFVNLTPELCLY